MQNIRFDDGFREYKINGDKSRVIRVNPSDFGIVSRLRAAQAALAELKPTDGPEGLAEIDRAVREQIDGVFGKGTSDAVFGGTNCASLAGGKPIYQNFLEAFMPIIEADIMAEKEKSDANIKKYTSQIKPS